MPGGGVVNSKLIWKKIANTMGGAKTVAYCRRDLFAGTLASRKVFEPPPHRARRRRVPLPLERTFLVLEIISCRQLRLVLVLVLVGYIFVRSSFAAEVADPTGDGDPDSRPARR